MRKLFKITPLLLTAASLLIFTGCAAKEPVTLNVSAAASLTDAIKEINILFTKQNPDVAITPNFASSGTLQTQIQNGAPVDVFISAAATQMDNLQKGSLILDNTRHNLLHNKIVLIVPDDSIIDLSSFNNLASDKVTKIAIGDPKSVPAGTYARQVFDELGIASQIQSKLVFCADVRQVLSYVESGNVEAGIVYATDAKTSGKVKVVASAPDDINAKVVYPVAIIKASQVAGAAQKYVDFLFSKQAQVIFEKYGFSTVEE